MNNKKSHSVVSCFSSRDVDTIPTSIETHYIDAKEYYFRLEVLLYQLGVTQSDPRWHMRLLLLEQFSYAVKKHYGLANPYFMYGEVCDWKGGNTYFY